MEKSQKLEKFPFKIGTVLVRQGIFFLSGSKRKIKIIGTNDNIGFYKYLDLSNTECYINKVRCHNMYKVSINYKLKNL